MSVIIERRQALAKELAHLIKTFIGVSANVIVGEPYSIERVTVGKARRVIDRRPKD